MLSVDLKQKLLDINDLVSPVINELLAKDIEPFTSEVALYQCSVGGKRIRPALVVISGQVFGADVNDLLYPAAAVEILHNSTLIVDDIIDHSEFRRNEPTCWNKYGKSIAECSSFMYLTSVFSGLSGSPHVAALIELYCRTTKIVIDGEIKDILFERSGRDNEPFVVKHRYHQISKDDYFKMIGQKTAILLQACCQAGAICASANDQQVNDIGEFGYNLGMAFQVRDDILDIFGSEKDFGKKIGKDIIEKKMGNFVILSALAKLDDDDRVVMQNIFEGSTEVTDAEIMVVTDLINKTDARKEADDVASGFIQKAFLALENLPQNEHTDDLRSMISYIADRSK